MSNVLGRVAQIETPLKNSTQTRGRLLKECSHHDGRTKERAAAL